MKTIRKWEWVRDYCIQQGFIKSAEIADQIDRVLCYLYGDQDTQEWNEFLEDKNKGEWLNVHPTEVYEKIITESLFCIACMGCTRCSQCKFSKLVGTCGKEGNPYLEFEDEYNKEQGDGYIIYD